MAGEQQKTLRGWKEIAAYVGRDVRTVQRWEERRGFPVRRLPGGEGGNVYALASDVDGWLHPANKTQSPESETVVAAVPVTPVPTKEPAADLAANDFTLVTANFEDKRRGWSTLRSVLRQRVARLGLGMLLGAMAVAAVVFFRFYQERVQAGGSLDHGRSGQHSAPQASAANPLYLQAMYLFEQRTPKSLLEAKRALLDVTAEEPNSGPAWAGLAEVSTLLYEYGVESDAGAPSRAREAAERALALDPELAEPHAVLGFADFFWHGDVGAAESEFQEALQRDPKSALTRSWFGTVLTYEARYPEALAQLNRAQMLEPSSTAILSNRALALGLSGHREEAVRLLEKAGGDTSIASVRFHLALLSLVQPCDPAAFLREELALTQFTHDEAAYRLYASAQQAYQRGGEPAMWRSIVTYAEHQPVGPEILAGAHAALGENDAALEVLAETQREHGTLLSLSMNPLLLPLHRDPRFRHFVAAEGLPPVS